MIYTICCKILYDGKSETSFNLRLNDHRKGVESSDATGACKHFNSKKHWFNKHAKFILTERIKNSKTTSTETLKIRLKERKTLT